MSDETPLTDYPNELLVKEALPLYFSKYHFKDGGYADKWFKIKAGLFYIPLPNIKPRVDAVKLHDIHHLITGYNANYKGEVQIGGWEIASGCGRYYMAWILNFGSFFIGLVAFPKALFVAFMNGRACNTNLYHNVSYNESLLSCSLGELRAKIYATPPRRPGPLSNYLMFFVYSLVALLYPALALLILYKLCQLAGG